MKKITLLCILLPLLGLSQIQIGNDIFGTDSFELCGSDISISDDGSIIAVSSPGSEGDGIGGNLAGQVRVFENINGTWTQIGQDINGESAGDESGEAISLSSDGSILAIGATGAVLNNTGHVRVFENVAGNWIQLGSDIIGENFNDYFGTSLDLSDDGSIISITGIGGPGSKGFVKVYEYNGTNWTQIGQNVIGESIGDFSGNSVSLSSDGSRFAVGARQNSGNGFSSGHVRVFENINGTWTQIGQDIDGNEFEQFGGRVRLSSNGTILAVAALGNIPSGNNIGFINIYSFNNGSWSQIGDTIIGEAAFNAFGSGISLSLDGTILTAGAPGFDTNNGKAYVYKNINNNWVELGSILGDNNGQQHGFALSLSSNASILGIGTPRDIDDNGITTGSGRVFNINDLLASVPAFIEVIEDITGNINGINVTATQLNSISGVSGAIDDVNYTTALDNGTFANENSPTAIEIQFIIDLVNASLGLDDNELFSFKLYPNPTKDQFTIALDASVQLEKVVMYTVLGQEVLISEETTVNTSKLSSGIYIVEIKTNKGKTSKKLVIE